MGAEEINLINSIGCQTLMIESQKMIKIIINTQKHWSATSYILLIWRRVRMSKMDNYFINY